MNSHIVGKEGGRILLILSSSGELIDLNGVSVVIKLQPRGTTTVLTVPNSILSPGDRLISVDLTGVSPGEYIIEIECTTPGDVLITYPDSELMILTILPGLP